MKRTLTGVTLLCLLVFLTGCATCEPEVIRVPFEKKVIEKVQAPEALLEPCLQPRLDTLETNGDIEQALGEAIISIETCNKDKERIREWQASDS